MRRRRTKSRKTTKSRSRGRRRMGAVSQSEIMSVVATIGGALASRLIVNQLAKVQGLSSTLSNTNTKAITQIGLGVITPALFGKKPLTKALANGMMIGGGIEIVKSIAPTYFGADESDVIVVSGLDEIGAMDMLGEGEISEINGMDEISEINGTDEYDYNY